jgi:ParB-like chromosome segregation protein Spo0J
MTTRPARPKPTITLEARRVADLVADPRNARKHSERNIAEIATSLRKYGQQKNVVITADGTLVAGSGTIAAAASIGMEYLDAKIFGGTVEEAIAYGLMDNRSGELAEWDDEQLAELLGGLAPDLRVASGWTPEEIADLLSAEPSPDVDTGPQLGDMEYRIIVECRDEKQQRDLLERLEAEGLDCRAVMS